MSRCWDRTCKSCSNIKHCQCLLIFSQPVWFCLQTFLKVDLSLVCYQWRPGQRGCVRLQETHQPCGRSRRSQAEDQIQGRSSSSQIQTRASSACASSQDEVVSQTSQAEAQSGGGRVRPVLERVLEESEASEVSLPEGQGDKTQSPRIHNHRGDEQQEVQTGCEPIRGGSDAIC